jgi:type IV secretion system protein VirD4
MKLRIKAEAKHFGAFIIVLILMFYLVSLVVLNLFQFASDTTLHGFNPLLVFSDEFIWPTVTLYLIAVGLLLAQGSSVLFEMEEGFGISFGKKEKGGYSTWTKSNDMKKELSRVSPSDEVSNVAGIPLINDGKEIWVDNGEYHNLVIGSTGSGKTQLVVLPLVKLLAKKGESMIITDPKGEIYRDNAVELRKRGYNVIVLNFRDPQLGSSWNPLMLPYELYKSGNKDKAIELLDDLAVNILYDEKNKADDFWEKTAANYFVGLALCLFEDAEADQININSINLMSNLGEERFRSGTYLKEYFSEKDPSSPAYVNMSSVLVAAQETKNSIFAVFYQKVKLFAARENISEMLAYNDINMKGIGRQKTAVFLIVQDEKKTLHPLVTTFIKQCYESLIDVAQENSDGKLKYRTNFILDEFANMPPLKDVTTMVTAARSRLMRMTFIIQNYAQLYQVYGKENGETIKGNCGNIVYLISSELSALEEISKMAGEKKSKEKDKTASTPLITVSDLQQLKMGEAIILRSRKAAFKTKLEFNYKMNWGKKYPKAEFVPREIKPIKLFNLKDFVDKRSQSQPKEKPFRTPSFFDSSSDSMPGFDSGIDVDAIMKRIDARISAAEETESDNGGNIFFEKQNVSVEPAEVISIPKEDKSIEEIMPKFIAPREVELTGTPLKEVPPMTRDIRIEPKIEKPIKVEETVIPEKKPFKITDDQFFDDFFSDDEE